MRRISLPGKEIGERLAGMKLVGERVDHGDAGVRRHFLEDTLMVNASDDALHPALEVARHVGDGLPRAERGGCLRVVQKNDGTTHTLDADVEGDPRAERRLSPERSGALRTRANCSTPADISAARAVTLTLARQVHRADLRSLRSARGSPSTSASRVWVVPSFFWTTRRHPPLSARGSPSPTVGAQPRALGCRASSLAVYHQRVLEEMCGELPASPVINALSDKFHPCRRSPISLPWKRNSAHWRGFKLAYVGDGNNVCHSLIYLAARFGRFTCASRRRRNTRPCLKLSPMASAWPAKRRPKSNWMTDPRESGERRASRLHRFVDQHWALKPRRKCVPRPSSLTR